MRIIDQIQTKQFKQDECWSCGSFSLDESESGAAKRKAPLIGTTLRIFFYIRVCSSSVKTSHWDKILDACICCARVSIFISV